MLKICKTAMVVTLTLTCMEHLGVETHCVPIQDMGVNNTVHGGGGSGGSRSGGGGDGCSLVLFTVMVRICGGFLCFLMLMDFDGGCFRVGGGGEGGQQWQWQQQWC